MDKAQVALLIRFLIRLRAENLALRRSLLGGSGAIEHETDFQERKLLELPEVLRALQTGDGPSKELLEKLSASPPR